jgi:hypothetical protein
LVQSPNKLTSYVFLRAWSKPVRETLPRPRDTGRGDRSRGPRDRSRGPRPRGPRDQSRIGRWQLYTSALGPQRTGQACQGVGSPLVYTDSCVSPQTLVRGPRRPKPGLPIDWDATFLGGLPEDPGTSGYPAIGGISGGARILGQVSQKDSISIKRKPRRHLFRRHRYHKR